MSKKNQEKHGLVITTKLKDGKIIIDNFDTKKRMIFPLAGAQSDKLNKKETLRRIYNDLVEPDMSDFEKKALWKNVQKNVDFNLVQVLNRIDELNSNSDRRSIKYARIMTENLDRHMYEKNNAYKKRIDLVKRVDLEDNGFVIKYDFNDMNLFGKGFLNKINIIKNALKYRRISKTNFLNIDEDENQMFEVQKIQDFHKNNFKQKFKSKHGLKEELRKKSKNLELHKKTRQRIANLGALTLMAFGVANLFSTTNNKTVIANNGKTTEEISIANSSTQINESKTRRNIIEDEKNLKAINDEENFNLKDILKSAVNIKLGTDSKFSLSEGTFWEKPNGTGKYGNIKSQDELYVTDIDVIDENGLKHYKITDKINLNEIRKKHQDAKFSYHINCLENGQEKIYGWITDEKVISQIDNKITNSRLKALINYLTPDAQEIFYNIVNNSSKNINKSNKEIIEKLIKEAQLAEEQDQNVKFSEERE